MSAGQETAPFSVVQSWLDDPLLFLHHFWPDLKIYSKQEEILLSVRDNKYTLCYAANETGKTWVAAAAGIWFWCTRFPAKVAIISSTEGHLRDTLWGEVDRLLRTAARPMGIVQKYLRLEIIDPERGRPYGDHFLEGKGAERVESLQGYHLPMPGGLPSVLMVMDESTAISDEFYDGATSMAHRLLGIGNPLTTSNWYYRGCKLGDVPDPDGPGLFSKVIHISGEDSPNVRAGKAWMKRGLPGKPTPVIPGILTYEEFRHRELTWDEAKKHVRLYGHFDTGSGQNMFPFDVLEAAEKAWPEIVGLERGPCSLGIDVAAGGRDLSVWIVLDRYGIVDIIVKDTPDTAVIATETIRLMEKYDIPAGRVAFDNGGGGKQIADNRFRNRGLKVRDVPFGASAFDSKTYKNRRAEMYWKLAIAMQPSSWTKVPVEDEDGKVLGERWVRCLAIPPDRDRLYSPELREELAVLPDLEDGEGRKYMLPKDKAKAGAGSKGLTLRQLLGRSPDRADALALAYWATRRHHGVARVSRSMVASPTTERQAAEEHRQQLKAAREEKEEGKEEQRQSLSERLFGKPTARPQVAEDYWEQQRG